MVLGIFLVAQQYQVPNSSSVVLHLTELQVAYSVLHSMAEMYA